MSVTSTLDVRRNYDAVDARINVRWQVSSAGGEVVKHVRLSMRRDGEEGWTQIFESQQWGDHPFYSTSQTLSLMRNTGALFVAETWTEGGQHYSNELRVGSGESDSKTWYD